MIRQERAYRELIIRRDILWLILDIRIYRELLHEQNYDNIKNSAMLEYFSLYKRIPERIDEIIDYTEEGLVNLNALDEYDDDLVKRLRELESKCTEEEAREIIDICNEMLYIKRCVKNIATLGTELMRLANEPYNRLDVDKRLQKILSLCPYKSDSSERDYLIHNSDNSDWYSSYFAYKKIDKGQHQIDFNELMSSMTGIRELRRTHLLEDFLPSYLKIGISIDSEVMKKVIADGTSRNINPYKAIAVMKAIRKSGAVLPFTVEEYFDEYIDKLKDSVYPHTLGLMIFRTFLSIINITDAEECLIAIGEKLASLENGEDVYMMFKRELDGELLNEHFSSTVEIAYNEEKRKLQEKRNELIMVLREVAKKKGS